MGLAGILYFLAQAEQLKIDLRIMLSSCVPATQLETNGGGQIRAEELLKLAGHPKALGLAEMMNMPGVLNHDPGFSPCWKPSPENLSTDTRRACAGKISPRTSERELPVVMSRRNLTRPRKKYRRECRSGFAKGVWRKISKIGGVTFRGTLDEFGILHG